MQTTNNIPEVIEHEQSHTKYIKGKFLGKGGFAKCFEFQNEATNANWAVKIISKSSLTKPRHHLKLQSEINIQKSLDHNNIVRFHTHIEDENNHYIFMELCSNQTLKDLLRKRKTFTEIEVKYYIYQLINALKYIHSKNVIHRDLKLGNLYLSYSLILKIGDFGLSAQLIDKFGRRNTVCGTPNYIAPEVLEQKNGHSFEADVWSIGVIVYCMLIGKPPFESPNVKQTYSKIKSNNYQFPENPQISDLAKSLIKNILVVNPTSRFTLDQILNDPFINSSIIPTSMPITTLVKPPNDSFISTFMLTTNGTKENIQLHTSKLNSTNPSPMKVENGISNLAFTTRITTCRPNTRILNAKKIPPILKNEITQKNPIIIETARSPKCNISNLKKYRCLYLENWNDMSDKYGVGYNLTNGNLGFYFNDQSTLMLLISKGVLIYIDLNKSRINKTNDFLKERYTLDNFPESLSKKVKILNYFKSIETKGIAQLKENDDTSEDFVKSLAKTKHGILFRLTNSITQMGFIDNSSIILNYKEKELLYKSKNNKLSKYKIESNLYSIADPHAIKRLKYTLNLINQLLGKSKE